jgi:ubiquinone/menaquinone biosynthesis C-methylase UbiE
MAIPLSRGIWLSVAATLLVLGIAGLGAGWLLQRYETSHAFDVEASLIAEALELAEGDAVADIIAGGGAWTIDLATRVGEAGHVYATGNDADEAAIISAAVDAAGVRNVTVVETPGDALELPDECCDAMLVRVMFHHLADGAGAANRMRQALKPGGLLAVIDYGNDAPEFAGGHGVEPDQLVDEITSAGFELVRVIEDWSGNAYCAIFKRPSS